ncbi:hypothetical protein AB0M95_36195 [Sphaerisporangium sp. NPDC051017]|uniref:hypothetical protein n=1 Tax=Sphaerisporangium sp. NPDC051017 TaxID=3154636 RepID=UPI0034140689
MSIRTTVLAATALAALTLTSTATAAVPQAPGRCGQQLDDWIDGGHAVYKGRALGEQKGEGADVTLAFDGDRVVLTFDRDTSPPLAYRFNPRVPLISIGATGFFVDLDEPRCDRDGVAAAHIIINVTKLLHLEGRVTRTE